MRRLLILATALGGLGGGLAYTAQQLYLAPGPAQAGQNLVIPHGGAASVGASLAAAGFVRAPWMFRWAAAATAWQGPLHAAEYALPAHASLARLLAILRFGRPVQHLLTIPEGLTALRIAALLQTAPGLTGAAVTPAEGSMLPQSYAYEWGTPRLTLVRRAQAAMRSLLESDWAARDPSVPISTPREALILASLVERETALPAERPMVAAVFYNRLRSGMKLQSDPTVLYAVSGGVGTLDRALTREDLAQPSPYNTYTQAGLPVGPICSPGQAALLAVLHPAVTGALYFVADGTGGHVFAVSLGEHNSNVRNYRALTRKRHP